MIPGIIGKSIWRTSANSATAAAVLLFSLLVFAGTQRNLFSNFLAGPKDMPISDIDRITNPADLDRYWVRTSVDPAAARFGSLRYTQHNSTLWFCFTVFTQNQTSYYVPLHVRTGYLLVESPTPTLSPSIEGDLRPLSPFDQKQILPRLPASIRENVLPVTLYRSSVASNTYAIFIFGGITALYSLWRLLSAIAFVCFPGLHPACRILKRFGKPGEIAVAVDAEFRARTKKNGKFHLTQSWLLRQNTFSFQLLYLGDVVWVYKKKTRVYLNFIPIATHHSIVICDRYGDRKQMRLNAEQVDELLTNIHRAVPWALIGFDQNLKRTWQKNRRELLMTVHYRKQGYMEKIRNAEAAKAGITTEEQPRIIRRSAPAPTSQPI